MGKDGPLSDIVDTVELKDIFFLVAVPVVLIVVHLLPGGVQSGLVLDTGDFLLANFFTTAFVHQSLGHLLGNIGSYALVVLPMFLMCALMGRKKRFYGMLLVFVLLFPFVLSLVNYYAFEFYVGESTTTMGFSGVVSALLGLMSLVIVSFSREELGLGLGYVDSLWFLAFTSLVLALVYDPVSQATALTLAFLLLFSWKIWRKVDAGSVKEAWNRKGRFELVLLAFIIFICTSFSMFPGDLVSGGGVVNILSHYIGFCLGFLSSYVFFIWKGVGV